MHHYNFCILVDGLDKVTILRRNVDTSTTRDCVKFLDMNSVSRINFVSVLLDYIWYYCVVSKIIYYMYVQFNKRQEGEKSDGPGFFWKDILLWHRKRLWLEKNMYHHKCNDEVFFSLFGSQLKLSGAFWAAIISPIWNWKHIIIGFICLFLLSCQSRTTYFTLEVQHMSACYITHTWYYKIRCNKIRVCHSYLGVCIFIWHNSTRKKVLWYELSLACVKSTKTRSNKHDYFVRSYLIHPNQVKMNFFFLDLASKIKIRLVTQYNFNFM